MLIVRRLFQRGNGCGAKAQVLPRREPPRPARLLRGCGCQRGQGQLRDALCWLEDQQCPSADKATEQDTVRQEGHFLRSQALIMQPELQREGR